MTDLLKKTKYDLFEDYKEYASNFKQAIVLNNTDNVSGKLTADLVIKMLKIFKVLRYEKSYINGREMISYYQKEIDSENFVEYNYSDISKDIYFITKALSAKVTDIKGLTDQTYAWLNAASYEFESLDIHPIKLAPKSLIKFNNGIFNTKKQEFYNSDSELYKKLIKDYDFIKAFTFDYLQEIEENNKYLLVWNKLVKDLSNNQEDQMLLFNQITHAVIEGNGRGKYIMLSGQAGSGKTTIGNVWMNIAGDKYTRYLTMDSFDDDNAINTLSLSTALVLGDDLQKSAKLIGKSLRHFKTLVDGNKLSVAVKYEPNKIIQTNAVWLQMMNDDPSIYEANDAIKDRTNLVRIEGRNHRNITEPAELEFSRRLDNYTGKSGKADENFIQVVVSHILNTVEYFEQFSFSERMKKDTASMVDDANWAYQFTEWLNDRGLFNFKKLPASDINIMFDFWQFENNRSLKKPAAQTLTKELMHQLKRYGYSLSEITVRINHKDLISYNRDIIDEEIPNIINKLTSTRSRMWEKSEDVISQADINEVIDSFDNKIKFKNYDELNVKTKIILKALNAAGNVEIMSWFLQFNN